jgi:hypothetical protein
MMHGSVTHMPMKKTQVYLPADDLKALHRLARKKGRPVADLVREAVRKVWLADRPRGPVAISNGLLRGTSSEHDAAFDEP